MSIVHSAGSEAIDISELSMPYSLSYLIGSDLIVRFASLDTDGQAMDRLQQISEYLL